MFNQPALPLPKGERAQIRRSAKRCLEILDELFGRDRRAPDQILDQLGVSSPKRRRPRRVWPRRCIAQVPDTPCLRLARRRLWTMSDISPRCAEERTYQRSGKTDANDPYLPSDDQACCDALQRRYRPDFRCRERDRCGIRLIFVQRRHLEGFGPNRGLYRCNFCR
jgi:hypothetical protein